MAKITDYNLREFPEAQSWLETLTGKNRNEPAALLKEQLGEENFRVFQQLVKIQEMTHSVQARMPFEFFIQ
jgi:protease-4